MKKNIFVILVLIFILVSCTKDDPVIDPPVKEDPGFNLKLNGNNWIAKTFKYEIESGNGLIYASDGIYAFSWVFDGDVEVKKYVLGTHEKKLVSSLYKSVPSPLVSYTILEGELDVTEFDQSKKILKGKFNFTAEDNGVNVVITDGTFFIDKF